MANEYCYLVLMPRQGGNPPERWEKSTRLSLDDANGEAAKWKARGFKTQVVHDITAEELAGREKCGRCEHVNSSHRTVGPCGICECVKFVTAEEYKIARETVKKVNKEAAEKKKYVELGLGDRCRCDHAKSMHKGKRHGGKCESNAGRCICPKFKLRGTGKVKKKAVKEIMDKGLPPLDITCDHKGGNMYSCDECRGNL